MAPLTLLSTKRVIGIFYKVQNTDVLQGTLDSMIYGSPWDPPDEVQDNVRKYVDEVSRVLKPGGKWLYITFRQPHFVKPQLLREGVWRVMVDDLNDGPGTFDYFAYFMTKHE